MHRTTDALPPRHRARAVLLVTLALAAQSLVWFFWWRQDATIARENGPMENFQAVAILIGLALLARGALQAPLPAQRLCLTGLAMFYLNLILLEVDTRRLGVPWLAWLCNGVPRATLLGSLWIVAGIWFAQHWRDTLRTFWRAMFAPPGAWLAASCFFWVAGRLAEELRMDKTTKLFIEEIPETNAALLMIVAGWVWAGALTPSRKPATSADADAIPVRSRSTARE